LHDPQIAQQSRKNSIMKTIIVGAGCAGLSAAYTLQKHGAETVLLEKEAVAGGRMQHQVYDGFHMDMGSQFVHEGYDTATRLLDELGLAGDVVAMDMSRVQMWRDGRWWYGQPTGSFRERLNSFRWMMKMGFKGARGLKRLLDASASLDGMNVSDTDWMLDIDTEDFASYVRREFGEDVLEYFVQPIMGGIALDHPENCGKAFGLAIMYAVANGKTAVLRQGTGQLARHLEARVADKAEVLTSTPVTRIVIENNRVRGVETAQGFIEADRVICAATATKTLEITSELPDAMRRALSKVRYAPAINVVLGVDQVMSRGGSSGGMVPRKSGYPISAILYNSAKSKAMVPEGCDSINVFFYGQSVHKMLTMSDEEITRETVRILRDICPDPLPAHIRFSNIARWPEANYAMPQGAAAAINRMRKSHYRHVAGLFLCGDYMYTGAYESALTSGAKAAEAALDLRASI